MSKPLAGRRIVVTRSVSQAPAFAAQLRALGAKPVVLSVIQVIPLAGQAVTKALGQIGRYDWVLFTSANAVRFFFARWEELELQRPLPRVAASGSATAEALRARQIEPDFVPAEFVSERLVEGLGDLEGQHILLPRSRIGRPEIVALLSERGGLVDDLPLYDTVTAEPDQAALAELARGVDAITFTSPSSVRNFLKIIADTPLKDILLSRPVVACIGPVTAQEARRLGLSVAVVPDEYTTAGLAHALARYFAGGSSTASEAAS